MKCVSVSLTGLRVGRGFGAPPPNPTVIRGAGGAVLKLEVGEGRGRMIIAVI